MNGHNWAGVVPVIRATAIARSAIAAHRKCERKSEE